jgi:hypothetical protein
MSNLSVANGAAADFQVHSGTPPPPILASTNPAAAGYSTYGDPRLRRYSISLRKSFGGR